MKKYFYDQFGKDIDKESKNFKAHAEKTQTEFKKCKHKDAKVINNELRCVCGASWSGPNLEMLIQNLKVV